MKTIHEFAPAKINLYLHVTGRRGDGYHDLDSLVAFATIGDEISLTPADDFSFKLTGPQASYLAKEDEDHNLVVKAARSLADLTGRKLDVALTLDKKLPLASGIGGGSSDAAAALRALALHWGLAKDDPRLHQAAAQHGQDVPLCLLPKNCYMTADGTLPSAPLPPVDVVLVNPLRALSTPKVYKEYRDGGDVFSPMSRLEYIPHDAEDLVAVLLERGNDLYAPACRLMPQIATVMAELQATPSCLLARMSGSGATCFGLYPNKVSARSAAQKLRGVHPQWWVDVGSLNV